nr:type I secretion system permease/ATPase [uncultured Pseudogulbenkiania sp.]
MDSASIKDIGISPRSVHVDPLLECLFQLTRIHGVTTTHEALVAGIPLANNRLTPALFGRAARRTGLASRVSRRPLDTIDQHLLPAVLLLKDDDACLLWGWNDDGSARISLGALSDGEMTMAREELDGRYLGYAIFVRPRFRFEPRAPELGRVRTRHWFWQALLECRPLYRDALVAATLLNMFALATPVVTMNVYDRVVPNRATDTLWVLALGLGLVLLFDFLLRMTRSYLIDIAGKRVDVMLSSLIFEKVVGLRFDARPASVGAFAANLRAFEQVRDFIASATVTAFVDLPFVLLFMAVIAWISPWFLLPLSLAMVLILGAALLIQPRMQSLTQDSFKAAAQRNAYLVEALVGLEAIKTQCAEGEQQRRWEAATLFLAQIGTRLKVLSSLASHFASFQQQVIVVGILIVGVYAIINGDASLGALIAAMMLSSRALSPMGQVAGLLTQYHNARNALTSLEGLMKMPVERDSDTPFFHRVQFVGEIEFNNVSFVYPGTQQAVLKDVSFRIKAGERVALLGRVGSGKSSLQKLMMGLYSPTEGAVRVDGIDIQQLDPAELRRHVGYAAQDPLLFYGSLRQNITMGSSFVHDASVVAATEMVGLSDFVNHHPQGYDMLIGERGESLSGGQRKAVCLARALVNAPRILLLDEPTSNMDSASETKVKQSLAKLAQGRTMVLVTHHAGLLDLVDRLIVLDQGQVVADGPKQQVLEALKEGRLGRGL